MEEKGRKKIFTMDVLASSLPYGVGSVIMACGLADLLWLGLMTAGQSTKVQYQI